MLLLYILIALLFIWLAGLTVTAVYIFKHFRRLSKGVGTGNLIEVLENLIQIEEKNSEAVKNLIKEFRRLEEDGFSHIQKLGLVRFNPFDELGGDHSFSLALLDSKDNGIVLTGLHTRDRTRIYSKEIVNGKTKYDLSKEEQRALKKAITA